MSVEFRLLSTWVLHALKLRALNPTDTSWLVLTITNNYIMSMHCTLHCSKYTDRLYSYLSHLVFRVEHLVSLPDTYSPSVQTPLQRLSSQSITTLLTPTGNFPWCIVVIASTAGGYLASPSTTAKPRPVQKHTHTHTHTHVSRRA